MEKIEKDFKGMLQIGDTVFIENDQLKVHMYNGTMIITDISNALKTGKDCVKYSIKNEVWGDNEGLYRFIHEYGYDFKQIFEDLENVSFVAYEKWDGYEEKDFKGMKVYKSTEKAIRVFSPFNLKYLKPLKETPKKWTVRHAVRLVVNGQYENLKCNGVYTDDYAYDAAVNYRQGEIKNGLAWIKGIIESPSGWWVSDRCGNDTELSICCHSFDSNSLVPKI